MLEKENVSFAACVADYRLTMTGTRILRMGAKKDIIERKYGLRDAASDSTPLTHRRAGLWPGIRP